MWFQRVSKEICYTIWMEFTYVVSSVHLFKLKYSVSNYQNTTNAAAGYTQVVPIYQSKSTQGQRISLKNTNGANIILWTDNCRKVLV